MFRGLIYSPKNVTKELPAASTTVT